MARPSGKALLSPAAVSLIQGVSADEQRAEFEQGSPPPDVLRAWQHLLNAIGTHLPERITRAQAATRAIKTLR